MDADDITFEDLLAGTADDAAPHKTFGQLLAEGFPRRGGPAQLAAIERMEDPGPKLAAVRFAYLEIVATQRRAAQTRS